MKIDIEEGGIFVLKGSTERERYCSGFIRCELCGRQLEDWYVKIIDKLDTQGLLSKDHEMLCCYCFNVKHAEVFEVDIVRIQINDKLCVMVKRSFYGVGVIQNVFSIHPTLEKSIRRRILTEINKKIQKLRAELEMR